MLDRRNECFCCRATLDELLADDVMEPVLRTAGYDRDEFHDMLREVAAAWSRLNGWYSKGAPQPKRQPVGNADSLTLKEIKNVRAGKD
jgi:hypothetical protein